MEVKWMNAGVKRYIVSQNKSNICSVKIVINCFALVWLSALNLCFYGCAFKPDTYKEAIYSSTINHRPEVASNLKFARVEPDQTVVMIYTTNCPHEVRAKPGKNLQFPNGDKIGIYRIKKASWHKQTVILEYMVKMAGPFYD